MPGRGILVGSSGASLVLALRECPYSLVHIENMRLLARAGAILAPPTPAFTIESPTLERFLDAYCVRVSRWLGLKIPGEDYQWKGPRPKRARTAAARARR